MSHPTRPPTATEVADGILRIEAPLGDRLNAMYLVGPPERLLLWDTATEGDVQPALAGAMAARALRPEALRYVIDSHADVDHMGGNRAVRAMAPGATLMCGDADRPLIEDVERMIAERYGEFAPDHGIELEPGMADWCRSVARDTPIDIGLAGGERVHLGGQHGRDGQDGRDGRDGQDGRRGGWAVHVIAVPGHSPGSIGLWDERGRVLLIGDAVLGAFVPTADGRPAFPPTYRHLDDYLASIARVRALRPDVLLASHEPVLRGSQVSAFLDQSVDFTERLDSAVRDALARARWTLADLALELGPRMGDWPADAHPIMRFPLLGHLERLVARGEARAERRGHHLVYSRAP